MAWTTVEPTVGSWEQTQTTYWEQNYFNIKTTQSIGRMSGQGYAVKMAIVVTYTYPSKFANAIPLYLSCAGNSTTSYSLNTKNTTLTVYYTDEAAAGTAIETIAGWTDSSGSRKTLSFTAPALLIQFAISLPTMKMGTDAVISVTRDSSWLISLSWTFGTKSGVLASSADIDSITWSIPDMASECDNAASGTVTVTGTAYSGSTLAGSATATGTLSVPSATVPSIGEVLIGSGNTISLPRKSSNFTHRLSYKFPVGGTETSIGTFTTDAAWTAPYSMASLIPSAMSGKGQLVCTTCNGTAVVGTISVTFTATVPLNDETRPTVSMVLSPVTDVLTSLYIATKSQVKAAFTASSKYSTIASYSLTVGGQTASGNPATTGTVTVSGELTVTGTVTDARGFSASVTDIINVYAYDSPRAIPYTGQTDIICTRADATGKEDDSGENLLIKAGRKYSSIGGNNACSMRYRIKASTSDTFGSWVTILTETAASDLVSYLGGNIQTTASYDVELSCVDKLGETVIRFTVPTSGATLHLREGGKGAAFGKYAEEDNLLDVAWDLRVLGSVLPTDSFTGDLNTLIDKTGYYVVTGCTNAPADGFLVVLSQGGFVFQVLLAQNGGIHTRAYTGTFTSWKEL